MQKLKLIKKNFNKASLNHSLCNRAQVSNHQRWNSRKNMDKRTECRNDHLLSDYLFDFKDKIRRIEIYIWSLNFW